MYAGRLILDLLNEPDTFNMTWGFANINTNGPAGSQVVPAWGDLYLDTAALLLEQTTNITLFAEGTGQKFQPGTAYGRLCWMAIATMWVVHKTQFGMPCV